MKNSFLLVLLTSCFTLSSYGQTIMTVGNQQVDKSEFLRVYEKNLAQKDPSNYTKAKLDTFRDLYSLFVMKLQEAKSQKLDTSRSFQYEINTYKNQLARKYAQENDYVSKLMREEYDRMQNEWNVSHILFKYEKNGSMDTAAALEKINSLRQKIAKGEMTFAEAANTHSEDTYSNNDGGMMGWMTAMQTPYTFETAVANTSVGGVSEPFFTKYGMHIVTVNDKRPNFGKIKVAQILINAYNASPEEVSVAKTKADQIYANIKSGKISFEDAVEKYSEDKFSNENRGEMEWFGPGENVAIFEDACLAMKTGDITEPVHTDFGYHIVKKLDQKPLESFEEKAPILKQSIMNSDRGALAKQKESDEMNKLLNVKQYQSNLSELILELDSAKIASGKFTDKERNTPIFSIENQEYTFQDFLEKYRKEGLNANNQPKIKFSNFYNQYLGAEVQSHYIDYLSREKPEFKNLLNDYEDGLLIFALMEKNVWQKAAKDTLGLMNYYEKHQDKYQWNNAVEYDVYTSNNKAALEKLVMTLGKINSVPEEAVAIVQESLPEANLVLQHKTQEIDHMPEAVIEPLKNGQNSAIIEKNGKYKLYAPLRYTPGKSQKTFTESRSYVISDYQNKLDMDWNQYLKSKYNVKINEPVYNSLIK